MQQDFPKNTAVAQYYVPELQAASAIGVNEPEKALATSGCFEHYDEMSLTPYLRGMANAALGQMPAAIRDFQTMLTRRGMDVAFVGSAYPMAEINVARALCCES